MRRNDGDRIMKRAVLGSFLSVLVRQPHDNRVAFADDKFACHYTRPCALALSISIKCIDSDNFPCFHADNFSVGRSYI